MLSLLDLLHRIDSGRSSAESALRSAQDAIAARDGDIQAFVHVDETARAAATGPLRGIAVGIKDIIDTADMPTRMGSPIYADWRPRADAAIVAALRRAGATPVGKTATTPFAYLDPVATRNPHHLGHSPGGSSSGSAAAVAAGMVPLALGTQTGGSIIRPASFCGVAAIKPSYRLLPSVGVKCYSWTLDTVGLFAAGVVDLAHALAVLTGRDALKPSGGSPAAPRIGLVVQDFAGEPERDSAAVLETAARLCVRAGAVVRPVALPSILAEAWAVHPTVQQFEARQALSWEYDHHRATLPPLVGKALDEGGAITPDAYDAARRVAHRARSALKDTFAEVDVLLTFSAPGAAPATLASTGSARFNRLWTLMGTPCVNVPGPVDAGTLPVGVQVIASFGDDRIALEAARFVEDAIRHRA